MGNDFAMGVPLSQRIPYPCNATMYLKTEIFRGIMLKLLWFYESSVVSEDPVLLIQRL